MDGFTTTNYIHYEAIRLIVYGHFDTWRVVLIKVILL
jgi:hypothetical protein